MKSRDQLLGKISISARHAYLPVLSICLSESEEDTSLQSFYGGVPAVPKGTTWPTCEGCGDRLEFYLQLNLADVSKQVGKEIGDGLFQLFLCRNVLDCPSAEDDFLDPFSGAKLLRRIPAKDLVFPDYEDRGETQHKKIILDWLPKEDFPSYMELEPLGIAGSPHDVDLVMGDAGWDHLRDLPNIWADKLLGWPSWSHDPDYPRCPKCGDRTSYLFQVLSDLHITIPSARTNTYLFHCESCRDVFGFTFE